MSEGRKPSRELAVGEIVTWTFSLYSQKFMQYLIPFLGAGVVTGILSAVVNFVIRTPAALPPTATPQELLNWFPGFLAALLAIAVLTGIIGWIVSHIANGIAIKFTSDTLEKGKANILSSFNFAMTKLLSILAVSIITGILIVIGLIALIVPGIILMIMFSLVVPPIIIEDVGALESLSRSRILVSHRWLKTFGVLLILYVLVGIASGLATLISSPFGAASSLVTNILTAFIQPIIPIGLTLYYYSMTARMTSPESPSPPS